MKSVDERYAELLQQSLSTGDEAPLLAEARSIGAALDEQGVPRAAMEEIHTSALRRLGEAAPDVALSDAMPRVSEILLEVGRAYEAARRRRMSELPDDEEVPSSFADDDFLALLTHELRTPLSPILTWAELLRSESSGADGSASMDPAQTASAVGAIERNARALQAMIDDLSVAARSASGRLPYAPERVDLAPIVTDVVAGFRGEAEGKGVRVGVKCDPSLPVEGEARRLRQVLRNLVGNAVKFTSHGGEVEVEATRSDDMVRLVVSDTGRGLGAADLSRIFDRVWPLSSAITRRHRGLGLGLAVVRRLVQLHGGSVVAESGGEGQGAVFAIELPAAEPSVGDALAVTEDPAESDLKGVRILVVDDEPDATEAARALLGHWGGIVETVASAEEALGALKSFKPDVLVSDLAMPRHDGFALLLAIRENESRTGIPRLPAIALTAHSREEERKKSIASGFDAVVSKPIESGELLETLLVLVRERAD